MSNTEENQPQENNLSESQTKQMRRVAERTEMPTDKS